MSREKTREVATPKPEKSETKAEKQHSTELDWEAAHSPKMWATACAPQDKHPLEHTKRQ